MPIPKSQNVSWLIHWLTNENKKRKKKWTRKQIIAIAIQQARKAGAKIPRRRKKTKKTIIK
ncbi:MAG: hypothetical protein AB1414_01135 [bacterium]